jgi:hypothetical protein
MWGKNLVTINTFVVANGYFGTVDESYTGAFTEANGVRKEEHNYKNTVFYLDKAIV